MREICDFVVYCLIVAIPLFVVLTLLVNEQISGKINTRHLSWLVQFRAVRIFFGSCQTIMGIILVPTITSFIIELHTKIFSTTDISRIIMDVWMFGFICIFFYGMMMVCILTGVGSVLIKTKDLPQNRLKPTEKAAD